MKVEWIIAAVIGNIFITMVYHGAWVSEDGAGISSPGTFLAYLGLMIFSWIFCFCKSAESE